VNVTYLVGSRNEGYGESGMAHLLEHLLFRGTPRFPNVKSEFLRRGARYNGSTSSDRTNYYQTLAANDDNLDWVLAMEADRMVNASITREDLDAEMTVVRNEFESGENSAASVLRQRVAGAAFQWHNYGRPTIGARSDIENVSIERLAAFYRTYYQPDNATVIVAGNFRPDAALALAQKHFAAIPKPARALPATYTVEPAQDGERSVVLRRVGDVQLASVMYHMPPGSHPDYAAVDVLVQILGHTPTGRLHKALVETGKASGTFGTESQLREAGYAYFGATARTDQSIEAARDALIATVEGLRSTPVTEDEVERARTRLLNDIELLLTNTRSLALVLSETEAMGDWRLLYLHRDRLRLVTPVEVQRVANAYLKSSNRTVGLFLPTQAPDRAEIPAVPDLAAMLKDYRGQSGVAAGESFVPTPANIEARVLRRELPGGMKVALFPKKTRGGTVVAQLRLRWGDEESKRGRSTACGIASALMQRGTRTKSREEISNAFARLKANVGVGGEGGSLQTVRESLPEALALMAEILREPSFPEREFEQLRQSSLASVESQRSDPAALSGLVLERHLNRFPPDHWLYTATIEERIERLKSLKLEDVRACHRDFHGASDSELAVVGDFDPDEMLKLAQKLFGDWKSPRPYARIPFPYQDVPALERVIETPDKANAVYRAGMNLRLKDDDPDYPALVLGNYLLGGSSDARLTRRIREKEGLSYSVSSFLTASSLDPSAEFGLYAIHAPQNRDKVETLMREELKLALDQGFTDEEVEAAKRGFLQSRQLARSQDSGLAGRLLSYLYLGRTLAWDEELERRITALTPAQVRDAMRRHVNPSKLSVVKAGDFNAAQRAGVR
jgi:zinc protease